MTNPLVEQHKAQGHFLTLGSNGAFVIEKGDGEAVVCLHGVPSSSFLYRQVLDGLAENGLRGISFDLLGMGLSDRPADADYSWTGLGKWTSDLIQALGLEAFHLVLHDIGGPIGCELISRMPTRILSVSILNAPIINLARFRKPFPMGFFPPKGVGEIFMATTTPFLFQQLMHLRGIHRNESFGLDIAKAYLQLLKGDNRGASFLKIMRSFEATAEKEQHYIQTLDNLAVPKQIIWGVNDPGLTLGQYGLPLRDSLVLPQIITTQGSHFLQEDYAAEVAQHVAALVSS